ncbi:uncharacterized protein C8Q71DRAFT_855954 [Rhodofomes roseus]|uniref:Uncharacterized protein n=1 Tax=Rhodofomes roseus TaxID=34475 RepID=A0ABQ8KN67_9APHY|nr:uncharacterized protein C8Q71DRAFT_855954 [Rhodofomes roseus]KAH9839330.1 hypothetical protein C8Q71DRAFT_855954 [Rhodofomes roseus]
MQKAAVASFWETKHPQDKVTTAKRVKNKATPISPLNDGRLDIEANKNAPQSGPSRHSQRLADNAREKMKAEGSAEKPKKSDRKARQTPSATTKPEKADSSTQPTWKGAAKLKGRGIISDTSEDDDVMDEREGNGNTAETRKRPRENTQVVESSKSSRNARRKVTQAIELGSVPEEPLQVSLHAESDHGDSNSLGSGSEDGADDDDSEPTPGKSKRNEEPPSPTQNPAQVNSDDEPPSPTQYQAGVSGGNDDFGLSEVEEVDDMLLLPVVKPKPKIETTQEHSVTSSTGTGTDDPSSSEEDANMDDDSDTEPDEAEGTDRPQQRRRVFKRKRLFSQDSSSDEPKPKRPAPQAVGMSDKRQNNVNREIDRIATRVSRSLSLASGSSRSSSPPGWAVVVNWS